MIVIVIFTEELTRQENESFSKTETADSINSGFNQEVNLETKNLNGNWHKVKLTILSHISSELNKQIELRPMIHDVTVTNLLEQCFLQCYVTV